MPNKYQHLALYFRQNWGQDSLKAVMNILKSGEMTFYAKASHIPLKTLKRSFKNKDYKKASSG